MTLKQLLKRAIELYPTSRSMQRQWVRHTFNLYASGKHALLTGGWSKGVY